MMASDDLNLHFHCFMYVWRIATIPYVAHNVVFFHAKALTLKPIGRYQR